MVVKYSKRGPRRLKNLQQTRTLGNLIQVGPALRKGLDESGSRVSSNLNYCVVIFHQVGREHQFPTNFQYSTHLETACVIQQLPRRHIWLKVRLSQHLLQERREIAPQSYQNFVFRVCMRDVWTGTIRTRASSREKHSSVKSLPHSLYIDE